MVTAILYFIPMTRSLVIEPYALIEQLRSRLLCSLMGFIRNAFSARPTYFCQLSIFKLRNLCVLRGGISSWYGPRTVNLCCISDFNFTVLHSKVSSYRLLPTSFLACAGNLKTIPTMEKANLEDTHNSLQTTT
jgi:hypothetical protein